MIYVRSQVVPFVILFEGRTGSTYFCQHLQSHPRIKAGLEILGPLRERPAAEQIAFARQALTPPLIGRHKAVGFKTKLRILDEAAPFAALLKELNVRVIYMQRRNRIKVTVSAICSNMLKEKVNDFNVYSEKDRLGRVTIPPEEFDRTLTEREVLDQELNDFVTGLELPTLEIFYEDVLESVERQVERVCEFLEVPYQKTHSDMVKASSDNLQEMLENFDELKSRYAGTPYEAMFG